MPSTFDRVQARAATFQPLRAFLSVLAAPFYAIGFLVGLLLVIVSWVVAAVQVGAADARARRAPAGDG
jgi:uncharacterized membrane protein (DUF485 family)